MIYITIAIIIIAILIFVYRIQIDFRSIFQRGKHLKSSQYGLRDVSGVQGSGKTSFCLTKLFQYRKNYKLYANMKNIKGLDYTYFDGFEGLFEIVKEIDNYNFRFPHKPLKYCIFFDELFSELKKTSQSTKEILKVLCQLRKRHIILLTTCQSFPELPLWFRRLCKYEIEIHNIPLLTGSYFIAVYKDGYKIKWDEIQQEFDAPIVVTKIEKVKKRIIDSYNTDEVIASGSFLDGVPSQDTVIKGD